MKNKNKTNSISNSPRGSILFEYLKLPMPLAVGRL